MYDITDESSFARVRDWVKELRKILGEGIVLGIAGNKADMEKSRHVRKEEALEYAASVGATHYLTSAKTGVGINEAFTDLMKRAWRRWRAGHPVGSLSTSHVAVPLSHPPQAPWPRGEQARPPQLSVPVLG